MRDLSQNVDRVQIKPGQDPAWRDRKGGKRDDPSNERIIETEVKRMMNLDDPVVCLIRQEMEDRKINGDTVAENIYINRSTFYKRLERPETIRLDELRSMARFFGMDVGDLARGIQ